MGESTHLSERRKQKGRRKGAKAKAKDETTRPRDGKKMAISEK
jgi:hypothetical protein